MNEPAKKKEKPLKGVRFEDLYGYYRGHMPADVAKREAYQHIKTQNVIYHQSEYYE